MPTNTEYYLLFSNNIIVIIIANSLNYVII